MPVSDILARQPASLTRQQAADFALSADQMRRHAIRARRWDDAVFWQRERNRLLAFC